MPKAPKQVKKGGVPDYVTPEYIAAQREKREKAKLEKARANAEQGILPPEPAFDLSFIKRPMLPVNTADTAGVDVKIMTYNVLGQALIRRKLFPTNGDMLKWKWRSKVLLSEFKYYDADIMCLQEVDHAHLATFYITELTKLGYDSHFHRGEGKNHGLLISWKQSMFGLVKKETVDYDSDTGYDTGSKRTVPQTKTRNAALLVALKLKSSGKGLVVGTTHLFWHPQGTFERTRQGAILVRKAKTFSSEFATWPVFLAGDFNSLPSYPPYVSLTNPNETSDHSYGVLRDSAAHEYTKKDEEEEAPEDDDLDDEKIAGQSESVDTSETPCTDETAGTGKSTVEDIIELHTNNKVCMKSLYGQYYRYAHPENADIEARNGEPAFSNWAFAWRGLLDYIFVMDKGEEPARDGEIVPGIRVLELLRMPLPAEMGHEPSGQPRVGQYPSDHLCLMAKVRLDK